MGISLVYFLAEQAPPSITHSHRLLTNIASACRISRGLSQITSSHHGQLKFCVFWELVPLEVIMVIVIILNSLSENFCGAKKCEQTYQILDRCHLLHWQVHYTLLKVNGRI